MGIQNATLQDFTQDDAFALRYKSPSGRLRTSSRPLASILFTDEIPAYSFDRIEKLSAGEIVELDIVLSLISLTYYTGDTFRVISIKGRLRVLIIFLFVHYNKQKLIKSFTVINKTRNEAGILASRISLENADRTMNLTILN